MIKVIQKRLDVAAILSFIIPLCIYLLTLAPSVTFFDSGEFITAISCLGSPHSPGYPFFVNYAKPFTWLPFGNVAFRVNFATAVSGALACYGAYLMTLLILETTTCKTRTIRDARYIRLSAIAASLAFACSPRLWLQSNHDKPYPLVTFLVAVILFLVLRWRASYIIDNERPSYIYIAAFLMGLGTGAHHTIILMIPAFAFLILSMNWKIIFRLRDIIIAFIFGILGFAINLHLPIRATVHPLLNWANPQTKEQFLWHFLRKGYPTEQVTRDLPLLWSQLNAFNVPYEFTYAGFILMFVGMLAIIKKYTSVVISYFLALGCFLLVIVGYFNTPFETIFLTEEFFSPIYLFSVIFIGIGIFYLVSGLFALIAKTKLPLQMLDWLMAALVFVLPAAIFTLNFIKNDQHLNYVAYDYGSNVLRSAPQSAVLYTWGDSGAFPLWYLQGIEKVRDDLDVVHTPHLVFDWYLDGFPSLFKNSILRRIPLDSQSPETALLLAVTEQYPTRPIIIDYSTRFSVPFPEYKFLQKGITYQMLSQNAIMPSLPDLNVWNIYTTRGFMGSEMFFRDLDTGKAILIYANSRVETGEALIGVSRLGEGLENLRIAAQIAPELAPEVTRTLAKFGVK